MEVEVIKLVEESVCDKRKGSFWLVATWWPAPLTVANISSPSYTSAYPPTYKFNVKIEIGIN